MFHGVAIAAARSASARCAAGARVLRGSRPSVSKARVAHATSTWHKTHTWRWHAKHVRPTAHTWRTANPRLAADTMQRACERSRLVRLCAALAAHCEALLPVWGGPRHARVLYGMLGLLAMFSPATRGVLSCAAPICRYGGLYRLLRPAEMRETVRRGGLDETNARASASPKNDSLRRMILGAARSPAIALRVVRSLRVARACACAPSCSCAHVRSAWGVPIVGDARPA